MNKLTIGLILLFLTGCVSKRQYQRIEAEYITVKKAIKAQTQECKETLEQYLQAYLKEKAVK